MNLFNVDGKIYKTLEKFWTMVWIGFLWIVTSVPLFTLGAASCSAYYAMVKCVRNNEGHSTKEFFKSFKRNFLQATVMTVVYIVVGAAFSFAAWFYYHRQGGFNLGLRWFYYIIILLYLCTVTYAFSWLSRYEMTTFHALTYPIAITLMHLKNSIGLIVFWAASSIALYWAYNTFMFAILILMIPGIKCLLDTFLIEPVLKKYESIALANEKEGAKENGEEKENESKDGENGDDAKESENNL
ncbi:MAG: DUF624 domain-containing protein [Lachnospiraceae bacterium]|nr:DUF624 domain-containing protein [Lachnospiraceae bacterium]